MKKTNRTWATLQEAVSLVAERANPSEADVAIVAALFNSTPAHILKEASALKAAVIARKEAEMKKLAAETEALKKAQKQA